MCDIFIADSPTKWNEVLQNLKYFIEKEIKDISSIRVRRRCSTCFDRISDVEVKFQEEGFIVKDWSYNCHTYEEFENEIKVNKFDRSRIFADIHTYHDHAFRLELNYVMGSTVSIPLSSFYDLEDYKIHGQMAYKDRKLKLKQRGTKNGLVIMLQTFIDHHGLVPKYSDTIYIEWK